MRGSTDAPLFNQLHQLEARAGAGAERTHEQVCALSESPVDISAVKLCPCMQLKIDIADQKLQEAKADLKQQFEIANQACNSAREAFTVRDRL